MQQCENCKQKISLGQIFKSFWLKAYGPIVCSQCNTVYEHTLKNRILAGLSVGLGTVVGGLFWALSEADRDSKFLIDLIATVFFIFVFSTLVMFLFNFKRKKLESNQSHS
ncbi:TIGR04104 family putative zinc finger protein [Flagellimonas sp. GZD32]|uniref:TIGR04104 family putative zinc finger protein n=1 Tax=Flagellimonas cixiensis TaxID=3228750 RepID=UPI0035C92612